MLLAQCINDASSYYTVNSSQLIALLPPHEQPVISGSQCKKIYLSAARIAYQVTIPPHTATSLPASDKKLLRQVALWYGVSYQHLATYAHNFLLPTGYIDINQAWFPFLKELRTDTTKIYSDPTVNYASVAVICKIISSYDPGYWSQATPTLPAYRINHITLSYNHNLRLYYKYFKMSAKMNSVPLPLLLAIGQTESGFNPRALSSKGAEGIMQFMPDTADRFQVNPFNPASAIIGAGKYLRYLYDHLKNWTLTIAAYNAGLRAVQKYHDTIPPYQQTQQYVRLVTQRMRGF